MIARDFRKGYGSSLGSTQYIKEYARKKTGNTTSLLIKSERLAPSMPSLIHGERIKHLHPSPPQRKYPSTDSTRSQA